MTRDQIIQQLYQDKDIAQAIGKMHPVDLQDDLRQEMFLVLCEMPEERLYSLYDNGFLKFFIVRTMLNMAKSDRSGFYNLFRRTFSEYHDSYEKADETMPMDSELDNKLKRSMDELHWYEKNVFELYADNGKNILKLSRDTQIPYRSLLKTVIKVRRKLSKAVRKEDSKQKKLIGSYVHARLDLVIDVNKDIDMDGMLDVIDEINEFVRSKIEGRMKDDVCIRQVGGLRIKEVV